MVETMLTMQIEFKSVHTVKSTTFEETILLVFEKHHPVQRGSHSHPRQTDEVQTYVSVVSPFVFFTNIKQNLELTHTWELHLLVNCKHWLAMTNTRVWQETAKPVCEIQLTVWNLQ